MNRRFVTFALATWVAAFGAGGCGADAAETAAEEPAELGADLHREKPRIVLVHGAWADALGWQQVTALLLDRGYAVTAVENPLTSLATDIATTRRIIERETAKGPVIVVGHSFGGAVITGAAGGNANVKALVYVNAFAPDAGETVGDIATRYPSLLGTALVPDAAGFLFIDETKFRDVFCADLAPRAARVMAVSQKPVFAAAFAEPMTEPAWRSIPSYYLVGTDDHAIPVEAQRFMAERMSARTVEVRASHASFVSRPEVVVHLIEQAAGAR